MKRIGFLSFGHWSESPYSEVRTGSDALIQSVELAVAAELGDALGQAVEHVALGVDEALELPARAFQFLDVERVAGDAAAVPTHGHVHDA